MVQKDTKMIGPQHLRQIATLVETDTVEAAIATQSTTSKETSKEVIVTAAAALMIAMVTDMAALTLKECLQHLRPTPPLIVMAVVEWVDR